MLGVVVLVDAVVNVTHAVLVAVARPIESSVKLESRRRRHWETGNRLNFCPFVGF